MEWKTDHIGRLLLAGLHDSLVDSFSYRDRTFEFTLMSRETEGLRTEFRLADVRTLTFEALWEGTIVGDIFLWNAHDVPEDFRLDPNAGWQHLFEGRGGSRERIDGEIERALKDLPPSGTLLSLVGSYGGSISVLCSNAEIRQSSPSML